jgi:dienelactone hydrolase
MGRRCTDLFGNEACILLASFLLLPSPAIGADDAAPLWDIRALGSAPATEPADSFGAENIHAIYFTGEPWQGKTTKVFAYYGLPDNATLESPAPGVVCVHGGGGTAFAEWVHIWNKQGFAAIAIDTNGAVPQAINDNNPDKHRHAWAGPPRYGFDQAAWDVRDQWPYHAVAAIIRAHSLLRSMPTVDSSNIGVTGISWGGYLTCLVAGVDPRFKFAIPVYGCGFVHEGTSWNKAVDDYGRDRWVSLWDPSSHLGKARLATLWINGTNDAHYHLPLFQKTYRLPQGPRSLSIRVRMDHGHGSGWAPPEIYAFAKAAVGKGDKLIEVAQQSCSGGRASVEYFAPSGVEVQSAELNYTTDGGAWRERYWQTIGATVEAAKKRVLADLPADATTCYFNLTDSRGLLVSSEHTEIR